MLFIRNHNSNKNTFLVNTQGMQANLSTCLPEVTLIRDLEFNTLDNSCVLLCHLLSYILQFLHRQPTARPRANHSEVQNGTKKITPVVVVQHYQSRQLLTTEAADC